MNTEVVRYQVILFGISCGRYLEVRKHNFETLRDAKSLTTILLGTHSEFLGYVIIEDNSNSWKVVDSNNSEYVDVVDGNVVASNLFKNTMIKHD